MRTMFLDTETTGLDPRKDRVRLIQSYDGEKVLVFDVFKNPKRMDHLVAICENPEIRKVFQNAAFDMAFIRAYAGRRVEFVNMYDTMLAEQVLLAGWGTPYLDKKTNEQKRRMPGFSLKDLAWRHLGQKLDKTEQKSDWGAPEITKSQMEYAALDVKILEPIYNIQMKLLKDNRLMHVAQLEFDMLSPVVEMNLSGMPFDADAAEQAIALKIKERDEKLRALDEMVLSRQKSRQMTLFGDVSNKSDMNMNSPTQIVKELKKLGYAVSSSDVETLKEIDHPWAQGLLAYRHIEKQVMFLTQWLDKHGGRSGRLYPNYNQNRAATGRMSSSNPNGQQIPKRGDGAVFRKLFKAAPGYKILKADFAQVELRVAAAIAGDKVMIDSIKKGVDLHTLTAATMAHIDTKDVTKAQRFNAKAINFGLVYGMGAKTLKKYAKLNYSVDMSEEEAQEAYKTYHELYAGITEWHKECSRAVKKEVYDYYMHTYDKGFYIQKVFNTETLFGRKRYWADWAGESLAKLTDSTNTPVQGSSADVTKMVLIELYKTLPAEVKIIGTIHDEVILEAPDALAQEAGDLMASIMRRIGTSITKTVPIDCELEIHQSWGGD